MDVLQAHGALRLEGTRLRRHRLPLFFLAMLIPARFSLETPGLDLLNGLSSTATYGIRSALGLATAFIAFRSFR